MAEVKKERESKPVTDARVIEEVITILVILLLLGYLFAQLGSSSGILESSGLLGWWRAVVEFFAWFWNLWKGIAAFLVVACLAWAFYSYFKLQQVISDEEAMYGAPVDDTFAEVKDENKRWQRVVENSNSNNPSDWRLAILEADVMLDDALHKVGYHGDTVGDMLKSINENDMMTLNHAWEAHKVRNRIAHDGSTFDLTERETKRVVALFESVFREMGVI